MRNPNTADAGVMLNAYPDSMGGTLGNIVAFLRREEVRGAFSSFYILPSLFNTDLDRGFSIIDYSLNEQLARRQDLQDLQQAGIDLKLDFVLNHASVLSPQFQDILHRGEDSPYADFFINWNKFWDGCGRMNEQGYIEPEERYIRDMYFRKPGLPLLMVRMPDGREVPYWNTFYQQVRYPTVDVYDLMEAMPVQYGTAEKLAGLVNRALADGKKPAQIEYGRLEPWRAAMTEFLESRRRYLGQMDLNVRSPLVWEYYRKTLDTLAEYGARIVRLDAFAYASKRPGARNFLNEPETWDILSRLAGLARDRGLQLLPEIHATYAEGTYAILAEKGYMTYDFFLPGLIIDALERQDGTALARWACELYDRKIRTVNMLGCHDGIPLLDLKGLIPEEQIQNLIRTIVDRGGYVKDLHGKKNMYYQVNATYYSALGEDDRKMLLARALQLFMPGKPQVWYLDLMAGKNDRDAVLRAGEGGHKEINRTNLTMEQVDRAMERRVVADQLRLLKFRNTCPAFGFDACMELTRPDLGTLTVRWSREGAWAELQADLVAASFRVRGTDGTGREIFSMEQA